MERIHYLIQQKQTGSAAELAQRLELSRSRTYQILAELRELGAPIKYCRFSKSFIYEYPVVLKIGYERKH